VFDDVVVGVIVTFCFRDLMTKNWEMNRV